MVYQRFDTPLSYCGVVVGSGSRNEGVGSWGSAHLVEHLLFKGTVKRNYLGILDYIEGVGGDVNAYTSKEDMCIYVSILSDYFERAVDVLSDVCFNSVFDPSDIDKEKGIVVDEINSYLDSPSDSIVDDFDEYMFPDSLFGRNILGSEESVLALDQLDLLSYYKSNYALDNMVFSYTGGLPYDIVLGFVQQYFGVESEKDVHSEPVKKIKSFYEILDKETFQAHCVYGAYSVDAFNENRLYYVFLNSILGGDSFNSLLNLKLREENGLTYNIDSTFSMYSDLGLFSVYFGTDYAKLEKSLDLINDLFVGFSRNPFDKEQFELRKKQFSGQVALHFDGFLSVMLSNAKSLSLYGSVDSYDEMCRKVKEMDYDVFVDVTRDLLCIDSFSTLIYK